MASEDLVSENLAGENAYEWRPANEDELKLFYETRILPQMEEAHACFINGKIVAVAANCPDPDYGGSWLEDGAKPMGFLDVAEGFKFKGLMGMDGVRRLRDALRAREKDVYVQHDHKFETAAKLLKALGFRPTGEYRRDMQQTGRSLQIWFRPKDA